MFFHVLDKSKELNFDYENRPYRFVDMETGEQLKLLPNEVKKNFKKQSQEFFYALKLNCIQNKIDYIESDINVGFDHILLSYLKKRVKLH